MEDIYESIIVFIFCMWAVHFDVFRASEQQSFLGW